MRIPRLALAFLVFVWVLVVLYPDPGVLVRSIHNGLRPRVDPAAASALAARLPDDPRLIEAYVLEQHVPYGGRLAVGGRALVLPDRAPRHLAAGPGDCESRAMVLASLLAAKGIPYDLRMSFGHIWVEYPGKAATRIENAGLGDRRPPRRSLLPAVAARSRRAPRDRRPDLDTLDAGAAGAGVPALPRRPAHPMGERDRRPAFRQRRGGRSRRGARRPA